VEWVETTGRTLEEAKDAALDQLGVDESDAEFEVLEEAKSGLFGRLRQEARVRARVRPTTPRPKADRRERRKRTGKLAETAEVVAKDVSDEPTQKAESTGRAPRRRSSPATKAPAAVAAAKEDRVEQDDIEEPSLTEQGETARAFVEGLVEAFGATGTTTVEEVDEETVEITVTGDDLGLLIGPKGQTLTAVQELTRTMVQRAAGAGRGARVRVDIGGYRMRRREALERFTRQIAEQVLSSGNPVALEPMSPPDRKVVHDTVNTIDGVRTTSEGEEPRRRVVLLPDGGGEG
jgi:spoIIIJ-associated protein